MSSSLAVLPLLDAELPLARGSHVTTMAELLLCGAIVAGGFGNPLLTGRQTHANITDAVQQQQRRRTLHQTLTPKHCRTRESGRSTHTDWLWTPRLLMGFPDPHLVNHNN